MIVNTGIRRFLGSAIQRLFNSASVSLPLTHTAIPTRGSITPAFTRATTETGQKWDEAGYLDFTALAGEPVFKGARREYNQWTTSSISLASGANKSLTLAAGTYQFSMGAGTGTATFSGTGGATGTLGASASGRVSVAKTITAGTFVVTASVADLADLQVCDITGETDQTTIRPYVSVGVESAPAYHGSMVDGVKCFPTDINGSPIPSSTLLGYQAQGAATNLCLQSNAFTTTWANSGTPAATQNVVGPDGATSAWTLTDNSAASTEGVSQTIALTAATYTYSVFVKKTTGAQSSYPVVTADNGVSRIAACTIDTTNGVATAWTAYTGLTVQTSSASCISHNANYWRVSLTFLATAENWVHYILAAATTNATQSTGTFDATAQGSAVFYGAQVNLGSFASSYIATTTTAVTRNADVLTYSSAGNIDGTKGWCYAEFDVANDSDGNQNIILGSDVAGVFPLYAQPSLGNVRTLDGINAPIAQSAPMTGVRKGVGTWGGSTLQCAHNGVVSTTTAFDGNMNVTSVVRVGEDNAGNSHLFGTIRNVRIGQRQLSASEMQAITS